MLNGSRFILLVALATLLGAAVLFEPVRVALVVAAVLVPGYLIAVAVWGEGLTLVDGILLSVALSVAALVIGGVALAAFGVDLSAVAWRVYLAIMAAIAGAAAVHRLGRTQVIRAPAFRAMDVAYAMLGLVLIGFALNVAAIGARDARTAGEQSLPQLWMLPAAADAGVVTVGVENVGGEQGSFELELLLDGSVVDTREIKLPPAQRWVGNFSIRGVVQRVDAVLYRPGSREPVRQVWRVAPDV